MDVLDHVLRVDDIEDPVIEWKTTGGVHVNIGLGFKGVGGEPPWRAVWTRADVEHVLVVTLKIALYHERAGHRAQAGKLAM